MADPLDLTLFELKVFARASRCRSLRALARDLSLKPAHVSKIIIRAENRVGFRLLRRSAGGIQVAPEALGFLRAAEEILERAESFTAGAKGARAAGRASPIGIGAVSFIHSCLVVPGLAQLEKASRGKRFRIVETPREELVSQGLAGAFEVAVHIGELEWPRSWQSRKAGVIRYALYSRRGHALGAQAAEDEVLRHAFVLPTYWVNQKLSAGSDLCPVSSQARLWGDETTTATTALEIVSRSDQLAFLPRVIAARAVARGELTEIAVPGWPAVARDVHVSVRTDAVTQTLHRALLKQLSGALS